MPVRRAVDITVDAEKLIQILTRAPDQLERSVGEAVYEEALVIFGQSQRLCPIDTGALRGSGMVHEPERDPAGVSVLISYGNTSVWYARMQHENDSFHHDPPTTAHFLEKPALARGPHIRRNINERLERILGELAQ